LTKKIQEFKAKNKDLENENFSIKALKNSLEKEIQLKSGLENRNSQIIKDFSSETRYLFEFPLDFSNNC